MRRFGTVTLILFAFVVGFVSTYSCGGGSSASAGGDADTLEGYSASAFALSTHSHPGYATTTLLSSHAHSEYADSRHQHDGPDILDGSIVNIINQGSAANAGDADTLDSMDSSDFADSSHSHTELGTLYPGVYKISPAVFRQSMLNSEEVWFTNGKLFGLSAGADSDAPFMPPFSCELNQMEIFATDDYIANSIQLSLSRTDGVSTEEIFAIDTGTIAAPGLTAFQSSTNNVLYNPNDNYSYWLHVNFSLNDSASLNLYWIKIFYTHPTS